jgi:hypothetical protein
MKLPDFSDSENKTDFLFQTVKTTTYVWKRQTGTCMYTPPSSQSLTTWPILG